MTFLLEIGDNISSIIEKVSNGDLKSFKILYTQFYDRLFKFSIHYTKSERASEEVVSDVFLNLWHKRTVLYEIESLETYLFKSVKNKSLSYIRDNSDFTNHVPLDSVFFVEDNYPAEDPEQIMMNDELRKLFQLEVDHLPDRCKIIFKLVKEDGMRYKQISEILGISIRTIDSQMAIAMKRIGEALKKYSGK